jgi:hypothetical protein
MVVWLGVASRTASARNLSVNLRRGWRGFGSVMTGLQEGDCLVSGRVPVFMMPLELINPINWLRKVKIIMIAKAANNKVVVALSRLRNLVLTGQRFGTDAHWRRVTPRTVFRNASPLPANDSAPASSIITRLSLAVLTRSASCAGRFERIVVLITS